MQILQIVSGHCRYSYGLQEGRNMYYVCNVMYSSAPNKVFVDASSYDTSGQFPLVWSPCFPDIFLLTRIHHHHLAALNMNSGTVTVRLISLQQPQLGIYFTMEELKMNLSFYCHLCKTNILQVSHYSNVISLILYIQGVI